MPLRLFIEYKQKTQKLAKNSIPTLYLYHVHAHAHYLDFGFLIVNVMCF